MWGALVAMGIVIALTGCSAREVQLWFTINKHQDVSKTDAVRLADLVNAKRVAGNCDANYNGGCVPDNATSVHCAGTDGYGPEVRGPLTVKGWDSFELDGDGDKNACVDPVGSLEQFGQELDSIVVKGWTFDPNSTDPTNIDVYDNGSGQRLLADDVRTDIDTRYKGAGTKHGFDLVSDAQVGTTRKVCVYAVNVGVGSNVQLKCKTITVLDIASVPVGGGTVQGLIESADRNADGSVSVSGFVNSTAAAPLTVSPFLKGNARAVTSREFLGKHATNRPDAADVLGTDNNAIGFEATLTKAQLRDSTLVCLDYTANSTAPASTVGGNVMCRNIDS